MTKPSVYTRITDQIIESLESCGQWQRPWINASGASTMPANLISGNDYKGINALNLYITGMAKGYSDSTWATFKQWKEKGASVRKGEKSTLVMFYQPTEKTLADGTKETSFFARSYSVFNIDQVDGYEDDSALDKTIKTPKTIEALGVDLRHGGNSAFFNPSQDFVQMPHESQFESRNAYLATLYHEVTHWTGHATRLNREYGKKFGDSAYAFEELVAEIGSAFICAKTGIENRVQDNHAAYIKSWLDILKSDSRAIFKAAKLAQDACDYIIKD